MSRRLRCSCQSMEWHVSEEAGGTLLECYCADCQTAAHALGAGDMLNAAGGTVIFQTLPAHVQITRGREHLALMRLGPNGLFRWHARCCGTPIANTLAFPGMSFAGMVLPPETEGFGKVSAQVQTKSARGRVREHGFAKTGYALLGRAIKARLSGLHRVTPFFDEAGKPVVAPRVISLDERQKASEAAQAGHTPPV